MKKLGTILLFVILFIGFITVWHFSYQSGFEEAVIKKVDDSSIRNTMPREKGVFRRAKHAIDYSQMPIDVTHQRVLENYYDNRAYHGAPPTIPHEISGERTHGGKRCLQCHENGGFVEKFQAYTPVTPHPELVNCRQCHVPEYTSKTFKPTNASTFTTPEVGVNNALLTSPPVIPHQIQLRENCLACHAGPSAPKEIRVSHPERVNCRQCHVPKSVIQGNEIFNRKPISNGKK
ncbi:MAG: cytochrome c3 family protein [Flavobacteriales bacterium]